MGYSLTRELTNCMGCGEEKVCHTSKYDRPLCIDPDIHIEGLNNMGLFTITCSLCDDCISNTNIDKKHKIRVRKQLDQKAGQVTNSVKTKNAELEHLFAEIADKDANALTDDEKKLIANKHQYDKQVQRAIKDLKVIRLDETIRAVKIGIGGTVIFAVLGLLTYGEKNFSFFGLKYTWLEFLMLIGAYLAIDVVSIILARKKVSKIIRELANTDIEGHVSFSGYQVNS